MTGVLIKRGNLDTEKTRTETQEDSHMKTETQIGVMLPQVRECLEPLEARRGKEESSQRAFRRNMALPIRGFQTSSLQSCKSVNFCGLRKKEKSLSRVQLFVTP